MKKSKVLEADVTSQPIVLTAGFHVVEPIVTNDADGSLIVVKEVGHATKDVLTELMARQLASNVERYHDKLRSLGVNVPDKISVSVTSIDGRRWGIVEKSTFRGVDLEKLVSKGSADDCRRLVEGIFSNLRLLFQQSDILTTSKLEVALDPKPANWVWSDSTGVSYVDFVPPRFSNGQGEVLLEFPCSTPLTQADWDFLYNRYFDRRGLVHILFVQLCRLRPAYRDMFREMVRNFLEELGDYITLQHFDSLPAQRVRTLMQSQADEGVIREIIRTLGEDSADDFRDIALELTSEQSSVLAELFQQSHVDLSGRLDPGRVSSLRGLLEKLICRCKQSGVP